MDSSHPDWHVMVPHCGFDLHFSDNAWCWASFHVFLKIWNTSRICVSSLCRGHANLCIVPILVYVLPKWALPYFLLSLNIIFRKCKRNKRTMISKSETTLDLKVSCWSRQKQEKSTISQELGFFFFFLMESISLSRKLLHWFIFIGTFKKSTCNKRENLFHQIKEDWI